MMAKKTAAKRKPAAVKRSSPARKSPPAKAKAKTKTKVKAVAAKAKPAPARPASKPVKKVVEKKTTVVARPKPKPVLLRPMTRTPVPQAASTRGPGGKCRWDLRDVVVTFSQGDYVTHFHYVRTNPEDCEVSIRYSSTMGGPLDNKINSPNDFGQADCSGRAKEWDAIEIIPDRYHVSVQLFQNLAPMTPPVVVQVKSIP